MSLKVINNHNEREGKREPESLYVIVSRLCMKAKIGKRAQSELCLKLIIRINHNNVNKLDYLLQYATIVAGGVI